MESERDVAVEGSATGGSIRRINMSHPVPRFSEAERMDTISFRTRIVLLQIRVFITYWLPRCRQHTERPSCVSRPSGYDSAVDDSRHPRKSGGTRSGA